MEMEESTAENCLICFESLTDGSEDSSTVEKTECEHVFHSHCLSEWFRIGVPGNYCPFCRSAIPGVEAETSDTEESGSEQSFSFYDSESEEPSLGTEQQQDSMSEDFRFSSTQIILEVEEGFIQTQNSFTELRTNLGTLQEFVSGFMPTTSSAQQEKVDTIFQFLSPLHESINNALGNIEKARDILSRFSVPLDSLDSSTIREMISDLREMGVSNQQHGRNVKEMWDRLLSMDILRSLTNGDNSSE